MTKLRSGFRPGAMEDKCFVFMEVGDLYAHRHWTGLGIYEVALAPAGDGRRIARAAVINDTDRYSRDGDGGAADVEALGAEVRPGRALRVRRPWKRIAAPISERASGRVAIAPGSANEFR